MHCSHPLNNSQPCNNVMLSRRALRLRTVHRSTLVSEWGTRNQSLFRVKQVCSCSSHRLNAPQAFDTGSGDKVRLPTQGESVVRGSGGAETMLQELPKPPADIDYLAVSPHSFTHGQLCCCQGFQQSRLAHCAGAHCSTAKWAKGYWVFWDTEYGVPAPKLDRSTQLCNGAHGMHFVLLH